MRLSVKKITEISSAYTVRLAADELNCQLAAAAVETTTSFVDSVLVNYRLSRITRRLVLDGEINSVLGLQCGLCLKDYRWPLQESFSLTLNLVDEEETLSTEELELDEEQINRLLVADGEVDLLPVLQEQVLVRLPLHPVCSDDCAGLCPYCGGDLNHTQCHCEPKPFNNRFGALKNINLNSSD